MPAKVRPDSHYSNWRMSKKNRHKRADQSSQCMLFTFYVLQFYCVPAIEYTKYNMRPANNNKNNNSSSNEKKRRIFTFNLSLFIKATSMKCASNCPASCKLNIYKKFHVQFMHISAFICLVALFPSLSLSIFTFDLSYFSHFPCEWHISIIKNECWWGASESWAMTQHCRVPFVLCVNDSMHPWIGDRSAWQQIKMKFLFNES